MKFLSILLVLVLIAAVGFFGFTYQRWEGQAPVITFNRDFTALARNPSIGLAVEDAGTGLKQVTIRLKVKDQDIVLSEDAFEPGTASMTYELGTLLADNTQEGPATISITATDHALRNFGGGNQAEVNKEFTFDLRPPRVEVLSSQHYINQGGAECVVYRVSEDAVDSGVQVGPHFFPGHPLNASDANTRFALFAFRYDQPVNTQVQVVARDAAGNEAIAGIQQRVFAKAFRNREIVLDEGFLNKVVPEIMSNTPSLQDQGDLLKNYIQINSMLRSQNHETITKLSAESAPQFLWNGGFLQLSNSQVEAAFADRRTYVYNGQNVDQQDHVGFDLSVVQRAPIEAANDGKVIFAEYFGIYGNTVLVDHGAGLVSLYAHMSSIDVTPGQSVRKKEILGRSGATGLAGGDHLHFGLFLYGVPVNPTEWWDEKWINDHVLSRLRS